MKQWVVVYSSGRQDLIIAKDLDDIYRITDGDIVAVIRLDVKADPPVEESSGN